MNPHVGSVFAAEVSPSESVKLKLTSVRKVMESEAAKLQRQAFALYFAGPRNPLLPQSIYRLRHEAFAEPLDIFLVAIENTAEGITYEAVFT